MTYNNFKIVVASGETTEAIRAALTKRTSYRKSVRQALEEGRESKRRRVPGVGSKGRDGAGEPRHLELLQVRAWSPGRVTVRLVLTDASGTWTPRERRRLSGVILEVEQRFQGWRETSTLKSTAGLRCTVILSQGRVPAQGGSA